MSTLEAKREQLQRLYVTLIEAEGIGNVHRWLSEAVIAHKRKAKKPAPEPKRESVASLKRRGSKPVCEATTITWKGATLVLGEKMRACNPRQQKLVLHHVRDGMSPYAAKLAAGYAPGGGACASPFVRMAIAEERQRIT